MIKKELLVIPHPVGTVHWEIYTGYIRCLRLDCKKLCEPMHADEKFL